MSDTYTITYANNPVAKRDGADDISTVTYDEPVRFETATRRAMRIASNVADLGTEVIIHGSDGERAGAVRFARGGWHITDNRSGERLARYTEV